MNRAVWAIVADTWRQSRQQVVYLLLAVFMAVVAIGAVLLVKVFPGADGKAVLALRWQENPSAGLEQAWDLTYRTAVAGDRMGEELRRPAREASQAKLELMEATRNVQRARLAAAPPAEQKALEQRLADAEARTEEKVREFERLEQQISAAAQALVEQRAPSMTALAKGVEVYCSQVALGLFWVTMLGFVAAAAGYFPGLMRAGAIDLVLAKPLARHEIFAGKYLGGLGLCAVALVASEFVLLVGLGIVTGVWSWTVLAAAPITLFSAGLLYAVVVLIGVVTRSTVLSLLGGYAYYLVVDTIISGLQSADALGLGIEWLEKTARISRWVFPGFGHLRTAASASVLNIPIFDWQPIGVGGVWLILLLGSGYLLFRRIDF